MAPGTPAGTGRAAAPASPSPARSSGPVAGANSGRSSAGHRTPSEPGTVAPGPSPAAAAPQMSFPSAAAASGRVVEQDRLTATRTARQPAPRLHPTVRLPPAALAVWSAELLAHRHGRSLLPA